MEAAIQDCEHAGVPCGEFLPDTDLYGADLPMPNPVRSNITQDSCLDLCLRTAGCDAFTWLPFVDASEQVGDCFLKSYVGQQATDMPGVSAYLLCPDEKEDLAPSSAEAGATPAM